ncbi:hypothetical protein EV586_102288 [Tumebacillus sp. BK434]|nr:hypothetical protein EV586_102288 [Tumebacillus sp. BK434]
MPTVKPLCLQIDDITMEHQAASFGTVYPDLVKRLNEEEKVIVEMSLNGVNVLPDGVFDVPSEKVELVVIRTKTMEEFALDLIETAEEYLPKLTNGMIQIASQFHAGREQEAHALLAEAIEGLEWADSCFAGLGQWAATKGNHELLVVSGTYQNQIVSVSFAMEQQNITDLADLLEYELAVTTEEGLKCLQVLRDLIKS